MFVWDLDSFVENVHRIPGPTLASQSAKKKTFTGAMLQHFLDLRTSSTFFFIIMEIENGCQFER